MRNAESPCARPGKEMVTIKENILTVEDYLSLRAAVGWKTLPYEQAERTLKNSLYNVCALSEDGTKLGMGRLVGDATYICYIQDLIVIPEAQTQGVGSQLITALTNYAESLRIPNTTMMLCLMCAKGREPFYLKHNFIARPTETLGPGMIRYLQ